MSTDREESPVADYIQSAVDDADYDWRSIVEDCVVYSMFIFLGIALGAMFTWALFTRTIPEEQVIEEGSRLTGGRTVEVYLTPKQLAEVPARVAYGGMAGVVVSVVAHAWLLWQRKRMEGGES